MKIKALMDSWIQVRLDEVQSVSSLIIKHPTESRSEKVGHATGHIVALPQRLLVQRVEKTNDGFTAKQTSAAITPHELGLEVNSRVLFRKYLAGINELDDGTCLIQWQDLIAIVPNDARVSDP